MDRASMERDLRAKIGLLNCEVCMVRTVGGQLAAQLCRNHGTTDKKIRSLVGIYATFAGPDVWKRVRVLPCSGVHHQTADCNCMVRATHVIADNETISKVKGAGIDARTRPADWSRYFAIATEVSVPCDAHSSQSQGTTVAVVNKVMRQIMKECLRESGVSPDSDMFKKIDEMGPPVSRQMDMTVMKETFEQRVRDAMERLGYDVHVEEATGSPFDSWEQASQSTRPGALGQATQDVLNRLGRLNRESDEGDSKVNELVDKLNMSDPGSVALQIINVLAGQVNANTQAVDNVVSTAIEVASLFKEHMESVHKNKFTIGEQAKTMATMAEFLAAVAHLHGNRLDTQAMLLEALAMEQQFDSIKLIEGALRSATKEGKKFNLFDKADETDTTQEKKS